MFVVYLNINCLKEKRLCLYSELKVKHYNWTVLLEWKEKLIMFEEEMRQKEILSLIIDGMDKNKTDLPYYCKWSNPSVCTFDILIL